MPSQAVEAGLKQLRESGIQELTLEGLRQLCSTVAGSQVRELIHRLDAAGITVTGAATGDQGHLRTSASAAEKLYQPIRLTARAAGGHAFGAPQAGEEVWKFTTSWDSWEKGCGRAGYGLVRDGVVVNVQVTSMS